MDISIGSILLSFIFLIAGSVFGYIVGTSRIDAKVYDRDATIQSLETDIQFLQTRVKALKETTSISSGNPR